MDAPWVGSKTPVAPPRAANPALRNLVYAGVVTGAWSGVLCLLVYGIARLAGVPFEIAPGGQGDLTMVPWPVVLLLPVVAALIGALLAALLRGRNHAGRIVYWAGTALAFVTCAAPVNQPAEVPWSTRILLVLMHVITWFLVVPQLARIVGDSEPRASVERSAQ